MRTALFVNSYMEFGLRMSEVTNARFGFSVDVQREYPGHELSVQRMDGQPLTDEQMAWMVAFGDGFMFAVDMFHKEVVRIGGADVLE